MYDEGVIKFKVEHRDLLLPKGSFHELACKLIAWRELLAKIELVGQNPARYGGYGFGNVSCRVGPPSQGKGRRSFLISGTQTAGTQCVNLDDFCVVEHYDLARNKLSSFGKILPSSESLTHGAIYDLSPTVRFVLHAHAPLIWEIASTLKIPTTNPSVPYGTPEMAFEINRLHRETPLWEKRILSMAGHKDGIIAFGKTARDAGATIMEYQALAFEHLCKTRGGNLCSQP